LGPRSIRCLRQSQKSFTRTSSSVARATLSASPTGRFRSWIRAGRKPRAVATSESYVYLRLAAHLATDTEISRWKKIDCPSRLGRLTRARQNGRDPSHSPLLEMPGDQFAVAPAACGSISLGVADGPVEKSCSADTVESRQRIRPRQPRRRSISPRSCAHERSSADRVGVAREGKLIGGTRSILGTSLLLRPRRCETGQLRCWSLRRASLRLRFVFLDEPAGDSRSRHKHLAGRCGERNNHRAPRPGQCTAGGAYFLE